VKGWGKRVKKGVLSWDLNFFKERKKWSAYSPSSLEKKNIQ